MQNKKMLINESNRWLLVHAPNSLGSLLLRFNIEELKMIRELDRAIKRKKVAILQMFK